MDKYIYAQVLIEQHKSKLTQHKCIVLTNYVHINRWWPPHHLTATWTELCQSCRCILMRQLTSVMTSVFLASPSCPSLLQLGWIPTMGGKGTLRCCCSSSGLVMRHPSGWCLGLLISPSPLCILLCTEWAMQLYGFWGRWLLSQPVMTWWRQEKVLPSWQGHQLSAQQLVQLTAVTSGLNLQQLPHSGIWTGSCFTPFSYRPLRTTVRNVLTSLWDILGPCTMPG